jgi:hypothetical protein
MRDTTWTKESDLSASHGDRELLGCEQYLVAPVIAKSRVVALIHVGYRSEGGVCANGIDVLDAFASAYSLLHERMLNTERVQQQRTSIARAAARLTEEADRIAAAAIHPRRRRRGPCRSPGHGGGFCTGSDAFAP